jgi:transposase InsO family protein
MTWADKQGIALTYIQPGKPQQNACVERDNRTVRHEWLALLLLWPHVVGAICGDAADRLIA